jgi:hypothetical protein
MEAMFFALYIFLSSFFSPIVLHKEKNPNHDVQEAQHRLLPIESLKLNRPASASLLIPSLLYKKHPCTSHAMHPFTLVSQR